MTQTVRVIRHRNSACLNAVAEGIDNPAGVVQFSSGSMTPAVDADVPSTLRNICRDNFQGNCLPGTAYRELTSNSEPHEDHGVLGYPVYDI